MRCIYLSPSNQAHNIFAYGGYNENSYSTELCFQIQRHLSKLADVGCIIGESTQEIHLRPLTAKAKNCSLYVAIHTNHSFNRMVTGTVCYYHPEDKMSIHLAEHVSNSLTEACSEIDNKPGVALDGTKVHARLRLTEIQIPFENGITPVFVEVNAHDNISLCQWLVNSSYDIAKVISLSLNNFV